jgi:hypothetical protein
VLREWIDNDCNGTITFQTPGATFRLEETYSIRTEISLNASSLGRSGVVIKAPFRGRHFEVHGGMLSTDSVVLRDGSDSSVGGGAVYVQQGTAVFRRTAFVNNTATGSGPMGGAVRAGGAARLVVQNCTFLGNSVVGTGNAWGGAIAVLDPDYNVTISGSVFRRNSVSVTSTLADVSV